MILEGVCEIRLAGGGPRETFTLLHRSIRGLSLARVIVDRWARDRYLLVSRAVYYVDTLDKGTIVRSLSRKQVFWKAVACLFRPGWLLTAKLLIKGWLHHNHTDYQDAVASSTHADWTENVGHVSEDRVVFADGAEVPLTTGVWRNGPFSSNRLAFYAHYDEGPVISADDLASLDRLKKAGFDVVVLSTSLDAAGCAALDVAGVLLRPNVGHDFLSWRIGLDVFAAEAARVKELLFTNNSMIFSDLAFVETITGFQSPFGCFAENLQGLPHAESVWWQLRLDLVGLEVIRGFFDGVVAHSAKQPIIGKYEHGFSAYMAERGYPYRALWPFILLATELANRRKKFPALYRRYRQEGALSPSKTLYPLMRDLGVGIYKKTAKLAAG